MLNIGVAETTISNQSELANILFLYFIIKDQRNTANHADDSNQKNIMEYGQITAILKILTNMLQVEA